MLCLRIIYAALTRWRDIMHHQCKSVQSSAICTLSSVLCTLKKLYIYVCLLEGGNSLCRLCSVVEMIIPNECNE